MPTPLLIVDAFAETAFTGNPAAVCLLQKPRGEDWMRSVASEMNLSETAFVVPRGDHDYDLRWFTPAVEVKLCGHATLASAHALWSTGRADASRPLRFHTLSGVLTATRKAERVVLDFPAQPPRVLDGSDPRCEALGPALGAEPEWIGGGGGNLFALFGSEARVRGLDPDFARLGRIEVQGVIATAAAEPDATPARDFVSRFFAPRVGVPEDPVTGSAHCSLGPFWSERLGRDALVGFQASRRGGFVHVSIQGNRVLLGGKAVTVLTGELA